MNYVHCKKKKNRISKKLKLRHREKENQNSIMNEMTIDKKIVKYNKMKEENDNQRNFLINEIRELKKNTEIKKTK